MEKQTEAQRIEQAIENFILKIEHKLPSEISDVCKKAETYISKAELLLQNTTITDFSKIVPDAEPARETILSILTVLGKWFNAVDSAMQKGLVTSAGAQISAAIHNAGANPNNYLIPFTTVYQNSKL